MSSPNQLSLDKLRREHWRCGIVERFVPQFADGVANMGDDVLLVQATRVDKVRESEDAHRSTLCAGREAESSTDNSTWLEQGCAAQVAQP